MTLQTVRRSILLGFTAAALTAVLGFVFVAAAQETEMAEGDTLVVKGSSTHDSGKTIGSFNTDKWVELVFNFLAKHRVSLPLAAGETYFEADCRDNLDACRDKLWEQSDFTDTETTIDFTVYLKGNRVRMDYGGSSMLGGMQDDGTVAEWAVLDPTTNRVVKDALSPLNSFPGVRRTLQQLAEEAPPGQQSVTPINGKRLIAGHTARGYGFFYAWVRGAGDLLAGLAVGGEVWIAEEGPYLDELRRSPFFRGSTIGGSSLLQEAAPDLVNELASLGPILETSEDIQLVALATLQHSKSSFRVTQILSEPKDDEYFSGFEREEQGCDCSCAGWNELNAISKLSKREQNAHPKSMTLSMCGIECLSEWTDCATPNRNRN